MSGIIIGSNDIMQLSMHLNIFKKYVCIFNQPKFLPPTFLASTYDNNIFKMTSNSNLPLSNLWLSFALIETNKPSAINLHVSRTEPSFIHDTHD